MNHERGSEENVVFAKVRVRPTLRYLGAAALVTMLLIPVRPGVVLGDSMEPSLHNGQAYLLERRDHVHAPILRGDVVVFEQDGKTYVKRVVAVGGDEIYLWRQRGHPETEVVRTWQLGRMLRMVHRPIFAATYRLSRQRIPEGSLFVVGDNAQNSLDSRNFGPIEVSQVRGKVLGAPPSGLGPVAGHFRPLPAGAS